VPVMTATPTPSQIFVFVFMCPLCLDRAAAA
jgi:hypothetical protein